VPDDPADRGGARRSPRTDPITGKGPLTMPNRHAVTPVPSERVGRPWRPVLALGVLTLVVGVVLTAFPVVAAFAVNLVIGVTLVVAGIERLIDSRRAGNRALAVVLGLVGIVVGAVALLAPRITLAVLAAVVGWGLLLTGVAGIAAGIGLRRVRGGVWLLVTGVLDLVAGVLALAWPGVTIVVLSLLFGIRTVLAGVADITYALAVRRAEATPAADR
jgi:uncharacterized membrane protein HdeD (DUF308 family)